MTPPAHRKKRGGKRATATGDPAPPPRERHTDVKESLLVRLRRNALSGPDLAALLYGASSQEAIRRIANTVRDLRRLGHVISHDGEVYTLLSSPAEPPPQKKRSPEHAVYSALTTRGRYPVCDCGAPASHVALFYQLTAECRYRYLNALVICTMCAAAFTDAEQILTMEEAYAMADVPVPATTQPRSPGRRPAARADCVADGSDGPGGGDSERQPVGRLPWVVGNGDGRA